MLRNFPTSFSHQSATDSNTHSKAYVTCHFNTIDTTTAQLQAFGTIISQPTMYQLAPQELFNDLLEQFEDYLLYAYILVV